MAALTTESANRVRQKTYMVNRNAGVFYALKALFLHLAANLSNPDLQLVNIDGTSMSSDGGAAQQVVVSSACSIYAIYTKKTGSVANWFKLTDHATTCQTNGTEDFHARTTTAAEERLYLFPSKFAMANGITIDENTTATGATETLKANRQDGFFILGA